MKNEGGHPRETLGLSRFLQRRFTTLLIRWLPLRIGRSYIRLLGKIYFLFNREEKEEIKLNLSSIIPRLPTTQPVDLLIRQTFHGIFSHYHEKLLTAYFPYDKVCRFMQKNVEFENQPLLDKALACSRGVILITAHFGAVEFLPTTLALSGYKVTMVVRFKTERLKRVLTQRAHRLGITLLDASQSESVIFSACQALRANQILITECDEFEAWRPYRNRSSLFLGCTSPLDRTLDILHRRYRSPVIMGLVHRNRSNHYTLRLHSLVNEVQGRPAASVAIQALSILEQYIHLAPDQWYQWKQVRSAVGAELFKEPVEIYPPQPDHVYVAPDSSVHV
jgi:KDO2-lipid IV(A) lauroyltransferase